MVESLTFFKKDIVMSNKNMNKTGRFDNFINCVLSQLNI